MKIGDLILIDVLSQQPTNWRMGRVTVVHPGRDDVMRVVTVRTRDGEFKRPVVKLVRLPVSA